MSPLEKPLPKPLHFSDAGTMGLQQGVLSSPYAPVLFIDEAIQVKMSFVSKSIAAHMDIGDINSLHHI